MDVDVREERKLGFFRLRLDYGRRQKIKAFKLRVFLATLMRRDTRVVHSPMNDAFPFPSNMRYLASNKNRIIKPFYYWILLLGVTIPISKLPNIQNTVMKFSLPFQPFQSRLPNLP